MDFSRKANGKRDLRIVRGTQAIADRVTHRLRTWLGETRYSRLAGVPWTQVVFVKGVTASTVRAVLEQHITETRGVSRVLDLQLFPDFRTRVVTGTAKILPVGAVDPFTIQLEIAPA